MYEYDEECLKTFLKKQGQLFDEPVAETLRGFNRLLSYIASTIILVLLFVAVVLISNTVMIGIAVRKEEIAIMKLIGATDFFVRAPFIVEGILIGVIGSAIPLTGIYFLYTRVVTFITERFSILNNLLDFVPASELYQTLLPVGLALGMAVLNSGVPVCQSQAMAPLKAIIGALALSSSA